jgi:gamma-glutamyltranspeptidase/glutathione hydrolase
MLVHFPDGRVVVVDGHSHAPSSVSTKSVKKSAQRSGYCSTTIPSTPATLGLAGEKFGRLPLPEVLAPAIQLATEGYTVSSLMRKQIQWCKTKLLQDRAASQLLLKKGKAPRKGTIFRQEKLGALLLRLASSGVADFYQGETAGIISEDMRLNGGLITEEDLASLQVPVIREPIRTSFLDYEIVSVPPPGGGLQLLQSLKVFEILCTQGGFIDCTIDTWYRTIARILQVVYRDRLSWPFKPEEMTDSMHRWLVSEDRARELAFLVKKESDLAVDDDSEEEGDTTHLCVADSDGMVVCLTQSIQSLYGAKVACEPLGFFYNNYLSTIPRHGKHLKLESNVSPRSNVAPTFVYHASNEGSNTPVLALGAAGSRRITSSIFQVILNQLVLKLPLDVAVDAPRVHGTLSGKAYLERRIASEEMLGGLAGSFRETEVKSARSYAMGGVQAIGRAGTNAWVGSADPRREGNAGGL